MHKSVCFFAYVLQLACSGLMHTFTALLIVPALPSVHQTSAASCLHPQQSVAQENFSWPPLWQPPAASLRAVPARGRVRADCVQSAHFGQAQQVVITWL